MCGCLETIKKKRANDIGIDLIYPQRCIIRSKRQFGEIDSEETLLCHETDAARGSWIQVRRPRIEDDIG